ncbi:hypothetical protein [Undibacterium squillarum]|uniref:hypothetical protein n=1 Tax=Undibacterium squillarum TaxID=1131567 RepID=UPI0016768EEB|nr:hypothetical protein [Undibacterium squillarum]
MKKGQKPVQNTAFRAFLAIWGQSGAVGYLLALADKRKSGLVKSAFFIQLLP